MPIKVTYGECIDTVHNGFTFLRVRSINQLINQRYIRTYRGFIDELIEKSINKIHWQKRLKELCKK